VSAKEVQRTLGVTYKTAWRMCNLIRKYMGYVDGDWPIGGAGGGSAPVEIDEAYIGGHLSRSEDPNWQANKKIALGMVERGGDIAAVHIPSTSTDNVERVIEKHVKKGSRVFTDTAPLYSAIETEYRRETVNHSKGEYVRGVVHTNTIEGFWSNVQRGISGTYVHVSSKHFQKYLWEFEYRHNMRHSQHLMLETLLVAFPR
jgi:transposase-like protein